jgi:hypothetical protein
MRSRHAHYDLLAVVDDHPVERHEDVSSSKASDIQRELNGALTAGTIHSFTVRVESREED